MNDGEEGYLVVTPLERKEGNKILCCRGWIPKKMRNQNTRTGDEALPTKEIEVQGLLREPWKKNAFTPVNRPDKREWYFPDVAEMAQHTGSDPVWIEETMSTCSTAPKFDFDLTC